MSLVANVRLYSNTVAAKSPSMATPPDDIDWSTILKIGRLLADYASNPIKLCSVSVTSLVPWSMFMATRMITRYET